MPDHLRSRIPQGRVYSTATRAVGLGWVLLFLTVAVFAQTTTGTIRGTVTDQSGAVMAGAKVTITSQETGASRVLTTNPQGLYVASLLPIGAYTVQAERQGFKTQTTRDVVLQVNQTARIDFSMQVGVVTQNVEVTAAAVLLKTDRSDVGTVIGERSVVEMPLNGRNFLQLATLAPGTIDIGHVDFILAADGGGAIANGASSNANQVTLDSVENQDFLVPRVGLRPSPDAIEEFKVMTGSYSAEYGRAAGANINIVTKSGTNEYRGEVHEFLRNEKLDARNFFDTASKLPPLRQNEFGGTFGGPILKNKTFFFFSYDGFRQIQSLTLNDILPTDAQRNGDLSSGPPIYDPLTTRTDPATGQVIRDPFPGNIIPPNRIAPEAVKALNLIWPRAQQQIPNTHNSVFNPRDVLTQNQEILRIDHYATEKDRIWGRFAYNKNPLFYHPFSPGFTGTGSVLNYFQTNFIAAYTRIISPTVVNDVRVGYNRFVQALGTDPLAKTECRVCAIGLNGVITDKADWGNPTFNIAGMTSVGDFPYAPSVPITNGFEYMDTLSVSKGTHSLKMGTDIRRAQQNGGQYPYGRGSWSFGGGLTRNLATAATAASTGQGFADFLLGYPSSSLVILGRTDNDVRDLNAGFFFQDDWNISRSLTLNLGLRYDYLPRPISAKDRYANWDEKDQAIILAQNNLNSIPPCAGCDGRTLASLISDWNGIFTFKTRNQVGWPRALVQSDYGTLAPRVGLAWRVLGSNKTILRGGWGRFYEVVAGNVQWNYSDQPPYARTLSFSADPNALPTLTLANAFPGTGVQGAPGTGVSLYNYQQPYDDNWNITLQRELLPAMSISVGYVATRGNRQLMPVDFNSPVFGLGTDQSRRPHPEHGSTSVGASWGHRWYDSLQAEWRTRIRTLSLLASYTWAHQLTEGGGGINEALQNARFSWNEFGIRPPVLSSSLSADDPYLAADKGPGAADVRQRFVVSYVWDLPVGKGRPLNLSGPLDWVVGGWELSGITQYQSGFPIPVAYIFGDRPNLIGNPQAGAPHTVQQWFNTSAFSAPLNNITVVQNGLNPLLALGNAGRAPVVGPGLENWDLGIYKNFPFKERYRLQFRAEMFNAFNKANFGDPDTTLGDPTFGQVSSAAPGREIQLALKLYF